MMLNKVALILLVLGLTNAYPKKDNALKAVKKIRPFNFCIFTNFFSLLAPILQCELGKIREIGQFGRIAIGGIHGISGTSGTQMDSYVPGYHSL